MCTGIELALLGAGASGAGSLFDSNEDSKAARRRTDANNRILAETTALNDPLAAEARGFFTDRLDQIAPEVFSAGQQGLTDNRIGSFSEAMATQPVLNNHISGSAPGVVQAAFDKGAAGAADKSTARAQSIGEVGGFGDAFFRQGLENENARRNISTNANLVRGNQNILDPLQQLEEIRTFKAKSPIGGLLKGAGSLISSAGGAGAGGGNLAGIGNRLASSTRVIR